MTATILCKFLVFINSPVNQSNTATSRELLQPSTAAVKTSALETWFDGRFSTRPGHLSGFK
jgi:hypothetical protein